MAGLAIRYVVQFDAEKARWDVLRAGNPTGAYAQEMNTAIGAACALADKESRTTDLDVSVWLSLKGKQKKVWPT